MLRAFSGEITTCSPWAKEPSDKLMKATDLWTRTDLAHPEILKFRELERSCWRVSKASAIVVGRHADVWLARIQYVEETWPLTLDKAPFFRKAREQPYIRLRVAKYGPYMMHPSGVPFFQRFQ